MEISFLVEMNMFFIIPGSDLYPNLTIKSSRFQINDSVCSFGLSGSAGRSDNTSSHSSHSTQSVLKIKTEVFVTYSIAVLGRKRFVA